MTDAQPKTAADVARKLSRRQISALGTVAWGHYHFGGLITGRTCRRDVVLSLVALGLVESNGMGTVCDGDGFMIQPERCREGFVLTASGIERGIQRDDYYTIELAKKLAREQQRKTA